jgi:hypothetical protein
MEGRLRMMDARRRLIELKHKVLPDQDALRQAAQELLHEFKQVALDTGYEVTEVPPGGLKIALPDQPFSANILTVGGAITAGVDRQLREGVGLGYDPVERAFVGGGPEGVLGVDVLANAVATLFERELERRREPGS